MNSSRNIPEEIKSRLTIEEVVGGYVPLKKAGRIFKGLCPFHSEKTPSFTVSPERGIFKCFGCGEGGDIFDFVTKIEGLTFPEAVKLLGEKAGVEIEEWQAPSEKERGGVSKPRLVELNGYVAKLWHAILTKHQSAADARNYLERRGLSQETIESFQVGYSPFGRATADKLQQAKFSQAEQRAAGDPARMQDRIIFPISDLTGKVVGFTGRLLELPDDPRSAASRGPKYWNTPETPLFVKSRTVYALDKAKAAIRENDLAILTEGQMDVIMLHQAGYQHAVASSGTALTAEQLRLIRRFTTHLAFAYDQDNAGIEATKRGIELAIENDLDASVIVVPSGKDPAECLLKEPTEWDHAYSNRLPYMDWIVAETLKGTPGTKLSSDEKRRLVKELLNWVVKVPQQHQQADWIRKIAAALNTSESDLREAYSRLHPGGTVPVSRSEEGRKQTTTTGRNLSETALALLLTFPATFPAVRNQLDTLLLSKADPVVMKVVGLLRTAPEKTELESFLDQALSPEERKQLALFSEEQLATYGDIEVDTTWAATELTLILQRIRSEARESEKSRLAQAISAAQDTGNTERVKELFAELQKLM